MQHPYFKEHLPAETSAKAGTPVTSLPAETSVKAGDACHAFGVKNLLARPKSRSWRDGGGGQIQFENLKMCQFENETIT